MSRTITILSFSLYQPKKEKEHSWDVLRPACICFIHYFFFFFLFLPWLNCTGKKFNFYCQNKRGVGNAENSPNHSGRGVGSSWFGPPSQQPQAHPKASTIQAPITIRHESHERLCKCGDLNSGSGPEGPTCLRSNEPSGRLDARLNYIHE